LPSLHEESLDSQKADDPLNQAFIHENSVIVTAGGLRDKFEFLQTSDGFNIGDILDKKEFH
jgi:hypothetical protein